MWRPRSKTFQKIYLSWHYNFAIKKLVARTTIDVKTNTQDNDTCRIMYDWSWATWFYHWKCED
jgi:phage gp16-like protein